MGMHPLIRLLVIHALGFAVAKLMFPFVTIGVFLCISAVMFTLDSIL